MLIQGTNLDGQIAKALSDERANDVAVFCASYKPVLGYLTQLLKESKDARDQIGELYIQEDFDPDDHEWFLETLVNEITFIAQKLDDEVHHENAHLMARLYANDILAYTEVEQTEKLVGYASLLGYPLAVLEDMSVVRDLKSHTYAERQAPDFYQEATLNIYKSKLVANLRQETDIPRRRYPKTFGRSKIASALSQIGSHSVDYFVVRSESSGKPSIPLESFNLERRGLEEFYSDGVIQISGKGKRRKSKPKSFITHPSVDLRVYKLVDQRKLIPR